MHITKIRKSTNEVTNRIERRLKIRSVKIHTPFGCYHTPHLLYSHPLATPYGINKLLFTPYNYVNHAFNPEIGVEHAYCKISKEKSGEKGVRKRIFL